MGLRTSKSKPAVARKRAAAGALTKDADATRANILNVAIQEFSRNGLSGARIDEIAAETGSNKGMIYYYFGSKEGLYAAAFEETCRRTREVEVGFHAESLPPLEALRHLVKCTFDYHAKHPEFTRLMMIENIHHGEYIRRIPQLQAANQSVVERMGALCARGIAENVFRADLDPVDLHTSIGALCCSNASNLYTESFVSDRDFKSPKIHAARREAVIDMVVRYVSVA
ncbi:MAG: TetR/AcrR family transcriptional regulator [Usitatibacteraceae bacterium]